MNLDQPNRLLSKVIRVSIETQRIVSRLPMPERRTYSPLATLILVPFEKAKPQVLQSYEKS